MSSNIPTGKGYSRLAAFPLDESSLFATLADAEDYAENSPIAYQTQIIGVIEKDMVYMISADKSLIPLIPQGTPIDPDDIDASKIILGEAVTLVGTALGGIPDGVTVTEETTLLELIQMMATKRIPATYEMPTLTLAGAGPFILEAGMNFSALMTPTFTQNDGGPVSEYKLFENNICAFSDTTAGQYEAGGHIIEDDTWNYHATVQYGDGPVKTDNLGDESPTGAIESGSLISETISFIGKRYTFYDVDDTTTAVADSGDVRSLTGKILGQEKGDSWTIGVPAGSRRITIAIPATLGEIASIKYVEQGGTEYKDLFVKQVFDVKGANGSSDTAYNVYSWITAVTTPATMTLNVTV